MPQTVVVTFYSRRGRTERLATAAAVGAVQARAGIRMRRLADVDPAATLERYPDATAAIRRMQKEYVAPREADLLAADAIILGLPDDMSPASGECAPFFDQLAQLHAEGKLGGKAAAVVGGGAASEPVVRALRKAGLTVVTPDAADGDDVDGAIALGRRVVAAAILLKHARDT